MALPTSPAAHRPALVDLRARPTHRDLPPRSRAAVPLAVLPVLLAATALGCLPLAAATTRWEDIGGVGLAGVLSVWAWAAVVCAALACAAEILRPRCRGPLLAGLTAVLILCTTGLPSVVEAAARIPVAWLHLGFVEAIARSDRLPVNVDSRFSWPGFFAHWAWISDAAGGLTLDGVLRWAPPVIVAAWAIGVHAIARALLGGTRAPFVAVWLFLGVNWIEQDYFSPQATAIVLVLAVLACVLGPLATVRGDPAGGDWPVPAPGSAPLPILRRVVAAASLPIRRPDREAGHVLLVWVVVALCLIGVVVDHPLTPFGIGAQLVVLAVGGRFWGRWLAVVLVVAELTWFVLGAADFWQSQFATNIRAEDVGGSLMSALFDRIVGDSGQLVVKIGRVVLAAATWALALAGAWVRWRRDRTWMILLLAAAPVGLVLAQSYGGEILLRVMLYALPFLAVLGTEVLRAVARRWPRSGRAVLVVGMTSLFVILVVLRGGNDAYVAVSPHDVAVSREVLNAAPRGAKILRLTNEGPIRLTQAAETVQASSTPACETIADDLIGCLQQERPDVLLVLPSMEAEGRYLDGYPPGWTRTAVNQAVATGRYRIVLDEGSSVVLARIGYR